MTDSHTHTTLGQRVSAVRRRTGLTQEELAKRSGVGYSTIQKLEQEQATTARMETLHKLAKAMGVNTTTLSGRQGDPEPAHADTVRLWQPTHDALVGKVADAEEPATVAGVSAVLEHFQAIFRTGRFSEIAPGMPGLIRDAASLGEDGRAVRCDVYSMAGWLLTHTHQYEPAQRALRLARDDAPDRHQIAAVEHVQSWLLIRQGRIDECHQRSAAWADQLERPFSKATAHELASWGWALLRVAMTAVRDNQPGGARDALRLAGAAAAAIGREMHADGDWRRPFGPAVVAAKAAELAMIEGRPDRVLELAETIDPAVAAHPSANWYRHHLDLANAYGRTGFTDRALGIFELLNTTAPQWLVEQRYARDILSTMFEKRRNLTPRMREMADAIRLPY